MKQALVFLKLWGISVVLMSQPSGDPWVTFLVAPSPDDALREDLSSFLEGVERDVDWVLETSDNEFDEQLEEDSSLEDPLLTVLSRLANQVDRDLFDPDHFVSERVRAVLNGGGVHMPVEAISYREFVLLAEDPERLLVILHHLEEEEKGKKGKQPREDEDYLDEEPETQIVEDAEFTDTLPFFPDEIWFQILSFLDIRDWVSFGATSKSGYRITHDKRFLGSGNEPLPKHLKSLRERVLWAVSYDMLGMLKYDARGNEFQLASYLSDAVRACAYDIVCYMLKRGVRLSDLQKNTAVASEHHPYRILLNASQEIRELLLRGQSLGVWHQAILSSDLKSVKTGAELNDEDPYFGYTPIHVAVLLGDIKAILYLFAQDGIDLGVLNREGLNIIHLAARLGNKAVLELLVGNCRLLLAQTDRDGLTPLHHAVYAESLDCVKLLVEQGEVDPNVLGGRSRETALHMAVRLGYREIVEFLLSMDGVDPNAVDSERNAPIHVAIRFGRDELLSYFRTSPCMNWNRHNSRGDGPAHQAVRERNINALLFLIELEEGLVNWELPNDFQHTPESLAAAIGDQAALNLLSQSSRADAHLYMPAEVEVDSAPRNESRLRRIARVIARRLPRF